MNHSSSIASSERNKEIYTSLDDRIIEKRLSSPYPIRKHAHDMQWLAFVDRVPAGATVLDAGCGPGVLSIMLAEKGCIVTGADISEPNIEEAKKYAAMKGVGDRITFLTADIESMPFPNKSFDYVVSSHVLEHVPDFEKGAQELARIARKEVIIAIPTCLSLGAAALLGRDRYWVLSRRSLTAVPHGIIRILIALLTGEEGVNEGYEGRMELIHIWRFPWVGKKKIEAGGLNVTSYGCSATIFPYFSFLLPLSRVLEKLAWLPFFRNFGHGTTYVCTPHAS
ncbi:MAG: class I SAM-dependent methyltransferase [Candidatus Peribacteraceae bacterium]